jgi:hypothetical protein
MVLRRLRTMQKEYGENNFFETDPELQKLILQSQVRIFWTAMIKGKHVVRSPGGGYTLARFADQQPSEQEAMDRARKELEQILGKDWAKK